MRMGETRRSESAHLLGCTRQNRGVSQHSSMKLPQVPGVCVMSRDLFSHLQPLLWVQEVPLHLSFPWFQQAPELQGCLEVPYRRKRNIVCWKRGQGVHTCTHPFLSSVKQSPSRRSVYDHPGSASTQWNCHEQGLQPGSRLILCHLSSIS